MVRILNILVVIAILGSIGFMILARSTPQFEYATAIYVEAPVEESFTVFQDPDRLGLWLDGFESIQYLRGEPESVGAFYRLTFEEGGETVIFTEEITELVENEVVSTSLDGPMMVVDISTRFESEGGGTRIVSTNTVRPKGLFYRGLLRLMSPLMRARQEDDFERLKVLIETG